MSKRKLLTPDLTERNWLRKNIPGRITRWKKRRIEKTLKDSGEHTTQHNSEDTTQKVDKSAELTQESDENDTQIEEQRGEPLILTQDWEGITQKALPFIPAQENDDDDAIQTVFGIEPVVLAQENTHVSSQGQEERAESFTMSCASQEVDAHSRGLTAKQSIISILSFAIRHNTTGVLMEDLLNLLKLHSAGTGAVPTSKYLLENR
ncbi:hypothetical protein OJAV_G00233290 [Oryzias javanicus]|uniref:Uncharacterized protein n=1 Tax=Oryzias javanicus TaxID=123683 RepID=A0A437C1H8_ORYJA|nr:hypothetical protein OJAV_G00233290 [Oryzias javanicus]